MIDHYHLPPAPLNPQSGRLLIVDDDERFALSLQRLLAAAGYEISLAYTGAVALETLQASTYDLALIDINLPDMSGHRLLADIRAHRRDIPVIVVSGETEIENAIQALREGALDYIQKPMEPDLILHAVRRALRQRSIECENRCIQQRLQRSERLHRYLVDRSPDIILMMDGEARIHFANNRAELLLGVKPDELVGRAMPELVHLDDRERAQYAFSPSKLIETSKHVLEFRLKCGSGMRDHRHFEILLAEAAWDAKTAADLCDDAERAAAPLPLPLPEGEALFYLVARDISARRDAEERARFHANHDTLTGLPNRNLFRDRLGLALVSARRMQQQLAVLFINIDRFKNVNELYGHTQADDLLIHVTQRIQACLRAGDTLARFGGDEFLLLNTGIEHPEEVTNIIKRVNDALGEPFHIGGKSLHVSVSAGIALYPNHGSDAEALIRHANIALYHGRMAGHVCHTFFMPEMGESAARRLTLEHDLREALAREEFELHYQPQMALDGKHIKGVEALLRWRHPRLGLLPPGDFLSVAEDAGLLPDIGDWVAERALKTLRKWEDQGLAPERMAINISPSQLAAGGFVDRLRLLMRDYAIAPQRVEIELTENLFIRDPNAAAQQLQAMAAQGVQIAIDDFGTQYSSLNYLQKFPIHTLKIDKSFVWEIDREFRQHTIIKAIIAIAHGLGLNLIAEGVETDEQLQFLHAHGCHEVQGYLVSRPLSEEAIEPLLRAGREPLQLAG